MRIAQQIRDEKMPKSQTLEKGLKGMALPLALEFLLTLSIPLLDAFFLSRISDQAAAAVGAVVPVYFAVFSLFSSLALAGASVASQYMGNRQYLDAEQTIAAYLVFSVMLTFGVAGFFLAFHDDVGVWMGLPEELALISAEYLAMVGVFSGLMGFRLVLAQILNAYGQPKWNTISAVITTGTNLVGNCIFLFGWFGLPQLGVKGVAFASVCSWVFSGVWLTYAVLVGLKLNLPWGSAISNFKKRLLPVLKIAIPSGFEPFSYQMSLTVYNLYIAQLGDAELALRTYTVNLFILCLVPTLSISNANQMLVAQHLGNHDYQKASAQLKQSRRWAIGVSFTLGLILVVFNQSVLGLFTDNSEILMMGFWTMIILALIEPFRAVNIVVGAALRSCGDAVFVLITAVSVTWLLIIPLAWLLGIYLGLGFYGVIFVGLFDEFLRSFINRRRWSANKWQRPVTVKA